MPPSLLRLNEIANIQNKVNFIIGSARTGKTSFLKVLVPVHSRTARAKVFTLSRIITVNPRAAYCEDSITNWANLKESLCG